MNIVILDYKHIIEITTKFWSTDLCILFIQQTVFTDVNLLENLLKIKLKYSKILTLDIK